MWTCIDTEAVQNQLALKHRRLSPSRGQQLSSQWRPEKTGAVAARKKTGAVTARKNGRGGGPKKRTQWRPEKTDPVAARKNGRGGGPKKRARWRPEKTDPLAARKNGKTARKNAPKTDPKTDPKTCPKNGPKTARKNGTLGLFVCFRGFPVFPGGPETSRKNGKPRFSRGQLHRFSGRADGFSRAL